MLVGLLCIAGLVVVEVWLVLVCVCSHDWIELMMVGHGGGWSAG